MKKDPHPSVIDSCRRAVIEALEERRLLSAAPLHVVGNHLEDNAGQTVRLAGVNVPSLEWENNGDRIVQSIGVAIDTWHANTIRLPVSQDRWFGHASGQTDGGASYRQQVDDAVAAVGDRDAYLVLDLHWSDQGVWGQSLNQYRMPDDNSATFWNDAAARYANNPSVLFGLYNEPHDVGWDVWRNGGSVPDYQTFHTPGMQSLLNTVRATGADNVVVAGGLDWAYSLTGITSGYALTDSAGGHGVMYDAHVYPFKSNWDANFGNESATVPVLVGEFGQDTNTIPGPAGWTDTLLDYLDTKNIGWTAWAMYTTTAPNLISDWNYTPTSVFGQPVKDRLAAYQQPTTPTSTPIALENASFENPILDPSRTNEGELYTPAGTNPAGWTFSWENYSDPNWINHYGIVDSSKGAFPNPNTPAGQNQLLPGTADGYQAAWAALPDNPASRQVVLTYSSSSMPLGTFTAGTTYTLQAAVGNRTDQWYGMDYSATLLADGVPVGTPGTFSFSQATNGSFYDVTYTYTATAADAGKAMDIQLKCHGDWTHALFDNVRLSQESENTNPALNAIFVQNASFEDAYVGGHVGTSGTGTYYTQGTLPGWTWSHNANPNDTGMMKPGPNNTFADAGGNLIAPADGQQLAWAGSTDSSNPLLTYTGTSLGTFVAGQTYVLSAALGLPASQGYQAPNGFGTVELTADGTVIASQSIATPPPGTMVDVTVNYTATAADEGKEIGIVIAQSNYYAQDAIDNVRLATTAASALVLNDADIGGPAIAGSASVSGSTYTVKGSGYDVWNTGDQFNFDSTTTSGDRTMIARVTGLTNTHTSAKAGVMFRDSSAASSAFVMVDVTPSGHIEFLSRGTAGGSTTYNGGATTGITPSAATPLWIKLARSGSTYTAFYATGVSTPGVWTQIASLNGITFTNTNYLAGLAVCSHDNTKLAAALFDELELA